MDAYRSRFDNRSAAEWLEQAERFDRMAERFAGNDERRSRFRALAADARNRAHERLDCYSQQE